MRELIVCVLLCVTLVNSATVYRSEREIVVPVVDEIVKEEIVSQLKSETIPVAIESEPVVAEIKEEIIVPIESSRYVEPIAAVEEPVAKINEPKEAVKAVLVEEVIVPELKASEPVFVEAIESVKTINNEPVIAAIAEEIIVPVQVENKVETLAAVEPVVAEKAVGEGLDEPESQSNLKQDGATQQPSLLMQVSNAIMNNPVVNALQNIRPGNRPQNNAAATQADESESGSTAPASPSPTQPTNPLEFIIRPIQQGWQQVGNVFNNAANNANAPASTANPTNPNPVQSLISNVQQSVTNLFQPISNLIRPQGSSASTVKPPDAGTEAKLEDADAHPAVELSDPKVPLNNQPIVSGNGPIQVIVETLSDLVDRDSTTLSYIPIDSNEEAIDDGKEKSVEPIVEQKVAEPVAAEVPLVEVNEPVKVEEVVV